MPNEEAQRVGARVAISYLTASLWRVPAQALSRATQSRHERGYDLRLGLRLRDRHLESQIHSVSRVWQGPAIQSTTIATISSWRPSVGLIQPTCRTLLAQAVMGSRLLSMTARFGRETKKKNFQPWGGDRAGSENAGGRAELGIPV